MFPPGTRGRARGLPYTMDAFMLGMGMLGESDGTWGPCRVTMGWGLWKPAPTYQLGKLFTCLGLSFLVCR